MARTGEATPRGRSKIDTHRQCALTRGRLPVAKLIRFVLDPDDRVVPDLRNRLPGRGVWLTCARDVVAAAVSKRIFAKAFRKTAIAVPALADLIAELLTKAALADLSLANKAGTLVLGFAKIQALAGTGSVIALVHGSDASEDGVRKLASLRAPAAENSPHTLPAITSFKVEELSLALGRPNVVHAALITGGASRKFLASAARLDAYCGRGVTFASGADRSLGEV